MEIVTDSLIGYWNSKQGVNGKTWENIAPATKGQYSVTIKNSEIVNDGMYFTDITSVMHFNIPLLGTITPFTWEMRVILNNTEIEPNIMEDEYSSRGVIFPDTSQWCVRLFDSSGVMSEYDFSAGEIIQDGKEYYIAFQYDPNSGYSQFFMNGELKDTKIYSKNLQFSTSGEFTLSSYAWAIVGIADNLRFYNRILTSEEVLNNYSVRRGVGLPTSTIVIDGLVGYWNSKKGINGNTWENIAPTTKGKYNGTINGAIIQDNGLYFDGIDDNVSIQTPSELLTSTSFTVEVMLDCEQYHGVILSSRSDAPLWISHLNGWGIDLESTSGNLYGIHHSLSSLEDGGEYYLAATYDVVTGEVVLYINGERSYTNWSLPNLRFTTSTEFYINSSERDANYYQEGIIDNIRLYNRILTDEEVLNNYSVGREIGLPERSLNPLDPIVGVIAKLGLDGTLTIRGDVLTGFNKVALTNVGHLQVNEVIQGSNKLFVTRDGKLYVKKLNERGL